MQLVELQKQFQLKSVKLRHLCTKSTGFIFGDWKLHHTSQKEIVCLYTLIVTMKFTIYSEIIAIDLKHIGFELLEI